MSIKNKYQLTMLPTFANTEEALFEERETGNTHLPFSVEWNLCNAIKNGNADLLNQIIEETLSSEIVIGNLSKKKIEQTKYWAVTVIATAIHYAILGGLDETDGYNLSDRYINELDAFTNSDQCIDYLREKSEELVQLVSAARAAQSDLSPKIKKITHYIHTHLHEKISLKELSILAGWSTDYLSVRFKKEVSLSIHEYILKQKLEESIRMLRQGKSCRETAYALGFSSQSHYIQAFKNKFGSTPIAYLNQEASNFIKA